jgi:hypothetical protein
MPRDGGYELSRRKAPARARRALPDSTKAVGSFASEAEIASATSAGPQAMAVAPVTSTRMTRNAFIY